MVMRSSWDMRSNHSGRERRFEPELDEASVHRLYAPARPHRVVELERLPGVAGVGVRVGVTGALERRHGDVVDPQVVGMRIAALIVGIGDDHLRPLPADDGDQPADGLVERGVGERVGMLVGLGVGHARVAITEHDHLVVADDLGRPGQLATPDRRQVGDHLGPVHGRVEDVAGLAPGARDQHRAHSLGVIAGNGAGPLRRLVVGMSVNREQAEFRIWPCFPLLLLRSGPLGLRRVACPLPRPLGPGSLSRPTGTLAHRRSRYRRRTVPKPTRAAAHLEPRGGIDSLV